MSLCHVFGDCVEVGGVVKFSASCKHATVKMSDSRQDCSVNGATELL